jgi:hypothetical protein
MVSSIMCGNYRLMIFLVMYLFPICICAKYTPGVNSEISSVLLFVSSICLPEIEYSTTLFMCSEEFIVTYVDVGFGKIET